MPRGDKTGPTGMGSMTGRGLGYCNPNNNLGNNQGFGRGMGRGRRMGAGLGRRGWFNQGYADSTTNDQMKQMSHDISSLKEEVIKLIGKLTS